MRCPSVDKMLAEMTSHDLAEWMAYFKIEAQEQDSMRQQKQAADSVKSMVKGRR